MVVLLIALVFLDSMRFRFGDFRVNRDELAALFLRAMEGLVDVLVLVAVGVGDERTTGA